MIVAVAIGNDDTELAVMDCESVVAKWRVASDDRRTPDEWAVLVRGLLQPETRRALTGVSLCSTHPGVLESWREFVATQFPDLPVVVVGPGIRTSIPILTDNPKEVGADRIVRALAAARAYGGPAVVVGFGTAITFDVVDSENRFVGGAIAPGLSVSRDALRRRASQLREVELIAPRSVIAKNTVDALRSGLVLGTASLIDSMVNRIAAELNQGPLTLIATGHGAELISSECESDIEVDADLILRGLAIIFDRNR